MPTAMPSEPLPPAGSLPPAGPLPPAGAPVPPTPLGAVLAPLRERYASWLGLDEAQVTRDREEDPAQVRAIQLVLRLERGEPPSWHDALALAATGCAAMCLDTRSEPGGEWHEAIDAYCRGHIRKVARRARGTQWEATAALPGLTLTREPRDGGHTTQVRVLVPGLVTQLDKRVSKLQVGGTDVPLDPPPAAPATGPLLTCYLPDDGNLTAGKLMAQTGHAGMIAAALAAADDQDVLGRWRDAGCPARVETVDAAGWGALLAAVHEPAPAWRRERLFAVRDAGFTEVAPGTVTVVARLDPQPTQALTSG